jgi:hypothetical protein
MLHTQTHHSSSLSFSSSHTLKRMVLTTNISLLNHAAASYPINCHTRLTIAGMHSHAPLAQLSPCSRLKYNASSLSLCALVVFSLLIHGSHTLPLSFSFKQSGHNPFPCCSCSLVFVCLNGYFAAQAPSLASFTRNCSSSAAGLACLVIWHPLLSLL